MGISIKGAIKMIVGKDNLKKKGIVKWGQEIYKNHQDNKVHNMKKKIEYVKEKNKYKKLKNLDLSIKEVGKPVEKNNDKIIGLNIEDKKNKEN